MEFWKYEANGNDFVVFDNRRLALSNGERNFFKRICDRKFGIGADGVLLLEDSSTHDFKMIYLNADGGEVDMCGNGARAMIHLAANLLGKKSLNFETRKGVYEGEVLAGGKVKVSMTELYDVEEIDISDLYSNAKKSYFANTGVPHCVFEVDDVDVVDLVNISRPIRNDGRFPEGTNVNFYQIKDKVLKMRTYERGVEDETLACGTGTVAVALAFRQMHPAEDKITIETRGGLMEVHFEKDKRFLVGEVNQVFKGQIEPQKFQ